MVSERLRPARRTLAIVALLAGTLLSAGLTGQAAAAPIPNYSLAVSAQADRSSSQPLAGTSYAQPGNIYVFATPTTSVKRVRFYLDDTAMARAPRSIDSAAPYDFMGTASDGSATELDLSTLSAASHTITAAVETTNARTGVVSASFTVTDPAAVTPPPPPPTATPAPFPSRLRASARSLVDENGVVMPTLRGFSMHVGPGFTWDQSHFDAIAARGGKINRAVLHWDQFEPTQGVVPTQALENLDLHIQRAQAAGIYTLLELHLNVGRYPSWTSAKSTEMEKYAAYGQKLTQTLAARYGNPSSPQYTKAVLGFGLNEPPLEDSTIRNGNSSIPYLEGKQRQMISWMRASGYAPNWIGFVAYGYASATPIYDDTWQNSSAVDASPTAYDSVGGNVIIDVHAYMEGCTNTDPSCDGRQWNGMSWPTYQGGPQIGVGAKYTSSALYRSQQAANLKPYKTFSTQANIPVMLGEWGWPTGSGELAWMNDIKQAWADLGPVIEINWNYDISATNTEWAARPAGTWRPSVAAWLPAT